MTSTDGRPHDITGRAPTAEGLVARERLPHRGLSIATCAVSQHKHIPIREQVKDSVEFVRLVWEEIERSLREEEP